MLISSNKMKFYGCSLLCYEEQSDIVDWLKRFIEHSVTNDETEVSVQNMCLLVIKEYLLMIYK